jgi:hypothetical protein
MMVARNRFSSQNESPKDLVRGTKNILTSGENTYWKVCIEHKKATSKISILIPLLAGAARSLVLNKDTRGQKGANNPDDPVRCFQRHE